MIKLGKKTKILILCISIVVTSSCLITLLSHHNGNETSYIQVDSKDMINSYKSKYSHLDLYKQNDKLIINAYSNSKTICNENISLCEKGWEILNDTIGE